MNIGPVDIRNHTFSRRMRGFDEGEVRAYLDLVAERLEEAIMEAEELRAHIDRLQGQLGEYQALERTMRDSIVSAERLSEERLARVEQEARIVTENAQLQAEKILAGAREEAARLRAAIDELRRQRLTYAERLRALLSSQTKILEASLRDLPLEPLSEPVREVIDQLAPGAPSPSARGTASPPSLSSSPPPARRSPSGVVPADPPPRRASSAEVPAPPRPPRASSAEVPAPPRPRRASSAEIPAPPGEGACEPEPAPYLGEEGLFSGSPPAEEAPRREAGD